MPSLTLARQSKNYDFLKKVAGDNPGAKVETSSDDEKLIISCPGRLVIHRKRADDAFSRKGERCSGELWDSLLDNVEDRIVKKTIDVIILEDPPE